jgi:hypothetical protein
VYTQNLGIEQHGNEGALFKWRGVDGATEHSTAWCIFPLASPYFDPSRATFMINYMLDDLDAILAKLGRSGARIDPKREDFDYGRFA